MKLTLDQVYKHLKNFVEDAEGKDYCSCSFEVNQRKYLGRQSKITPTKKGEFVTLWKRVNGETHPFEEMDAIDYVFILNHTKTGYFLFPKVVLLEKGILKSNSKNGKRGFRLYSPNDTDLNTQATKTQNWQKNFYQSLI